MKIFKTVHLYVSLLIAFGFLAAGCASGGGKEVAPVKFPNVKLPTFINDQSQTANYMVKNFWDSFFKMAKPLSSAAGAVHGVDSLSFEQAFGMYAQLLLMADMGVAEKSVEELFRNMDSLALAGERKPLLKVMELMEHYFYNPNSPVLDEEMYLRALNGIMGAKSLSQLDRMQYMYQQHICSLNRVGTPAADFVFREDMGNGRFVDRRMYDIKGEYTMLFFNNPDCGACAQILEAIKGSPLSGMINEGTLKILAMYIDEDLNAWSSNASKYPQGWIYAHDPQFVLRDNNIYGLRAIPSLYLLDKEKRVILKDAPVEMVISYFMR